MISFARKSLSLPAFYDGYQSLVGAPRCHERFISEMVRPERGERVLDIGCGVGASVRYLSEDVNYTGIDISAAYIAKAQKDYGGRGQFICTDVASVKAETIGTFDRAFAFGVLHHLSDEVATSVSDLVRRVVKPGGVFATIDPCYVPGQHWFAKLLIDNDRGEYVRDADGFQRVVSGLGDVDARIYHDLLRIPFTQIVMQVRLS